MSDRAARIAESDLRNNIAWTHESLRAAISRSETILRDPDSTPEDRDVATSQRSVYREMLEGVGVHEIIRLNVLRKRLQELTIQASALRNVFPPALRPEKQILACEILIDAVRDELGYSDHCGDMFGAISGQAIPGEIFA